MYINYLNIERCGIGMCVFCNSDKHNFLLLLKIWAFLQFPRYSMRNTNKKKSLIPNDRIIVKHPEKTN